VRMSTDSSSLRASHDYVANSPASDVHRTSQSMVKKKAALTLLRLYRKHPDAILAAEWALRIVSIMDDQDLVSSNR